MGFLIIGSHSRIYLTCQIILDFYFLLNYLLFNFTSSYNQVFFVEK
jgi:hypothetical protein